MNPEPQRLPPEARLALTECFAQIRRARATELAQAGRASEAQDVLLGNNRLPNDPRELDLLARLAARQGLFDTARQFWELAMEREPDNETYRQCMEQLTPARKARCLLVAWSGPLLMLLMLAALALGLGALVFRLFFP